MLTPRTFLYTLEMNTMSDAEFQKQCLCLLDRLPPEGVLILKEGQPVAKLMPVASSCVDLIGSIKNVTIDPDDSLFSTGMIWDAQS